MKIITLLALLSIAGCGDMVTENPKAVRDGVPDSFLFTHNYGYCNDTACVGESIILKDIEGGYQQCLIFNVTTGDTVHNGLNHYNITLSYDLFNAYSVNFGNGQTQTFNNNGTFEINWKCNRTYEVIICYE